MLQQIVRRIPRGVKDSALRVCDRLCAGYCELKRQVPFSAWNRISPADARTFAPVLNTWLPKQGKPARQLRWMITEWCNYHCAYCVGEHGRWAVKSRGSTAHAADNHPAEKWEDGFRRHFSDTRLSVNISGGEPFLDRPFITRMVNFLSALELTDTVRIDTNASWNPEAFADLDTSKLILMCTFHPSQVDARKFFANIEKLLQRGFRIGIINYVMTGEQKERQTYLAHRRTAASLGAVFNPNPELREGFSYSAEESAFLRSQLPDADYRYKAERASPRGKKCLYPAIGYYLDFQGLITVGCVPMARGSFFGKKLPVGPAGPIRCLYSLCKCLDGYSFLGEVNRNVTLNPLGVYAEQVKALHAKSEG